MPRLIPTIREILTNGPFKISVSVSLLALDSNPVARTSRVFKIGVERELVITVEACVIIKNKYRTFKNKRLQVAFTHARVHMGASVYSPGPEEN